MPQAASASGACQSRGNSADVDTPRFGCTRNAYVRRCRTERLGLPLVPSGMGFGTGAHAPNEIMLIEPTDGIPVAGLAEIEKAYVDFIFAFAESARNSATVQETR